jgi:hypothetical protein
MTDIAEVISERVHVARGSNSRGSGESESVSPVVRVHVATARNSANV